VDEPGSVACQMVSFYCHRIAIVLVS